MLPGWLRSFVLGVLCAVPLACTQVVASKAQLVVASAEAMCPVGSEGCPCAAGGRCDPGLWCDGGICVGDYGGEATIDFEQEMVAPEPSRSSGRWNRRMRKEAAKMPAAAEYAGDAGADYDEAETVADVPTGSTTPQDPAAPIDHGRQVIYTAVLHVSVYDLDTAAEFAESLPLRFGGWIESRNDYQITLRITAEHLFTAMDLLAELGVVLDKNLYALDVTAEYIDLAGRIRVLEQLVAHLEELLKMATTVEQMLKIHAALDQARLELAAARARMRELSESIDFSTLTLILSLRGPGDVVQTSNDPFPWVDELGAEITEYR